MTVKPEQSDGLEKRGIFRVKDGFQHSHSAVVEFPPFGNMVVPEDHYRAQGYQPDFDHLPWKDDVPASNPVAVSSQN